MERTDTQTFVRLLVLSLPLLQAFFFVPWQEDSPLRSTTLA